MLELQRFITKNSITLTKKKTMKEEIERTFKTKNQFNPRNITNSIREKFECGKGNKIHRLELKRDFKEAAKMMLDVRLNKFLKTSDLGRMNLIESEWAGKCLLCGLNTIENIEHWRM